MTEQMREQTNADVFWLYELTKGEGIYQAMRGPHAERVVKQIASEFPEAGEPFSIPATSSSEERVKTLREALTWAIKKIDAETCAHADTYRGGAIWTICRDCDRKWADDRGGFTPYVEPPELTAARKALEDTQ